MFNKKIFAKRITELRENKKIDQKELGKIIGLTPAAICLIEAEKRAASIETIYKLADYFDVSIDYLVGRTNIKKIIIEKE